MAKDAIVSQELADKFKTEKDSPYLRFVRGIVDSADLPLSLSREMIQRSPILTAIKKSVTGRVLGDLEKLADSDAEAYGKIWDVFGAVLKEGIYEDYERRDTLLKLARQGSLVRYPPLVEEDGVMVAQYEHSLYLGPDGVEILTA